MYLNSIQIIGFIGKDPERRQRQGSEAAYTLFSVATQRAWKNAQGAWERRTEWHRVVAWNVMGEQATCLKTGDHVHIQGRLVSGTYDRQYGNGKKPAVIRQTFWRVRADGIRKLNRTGTQSGSAPAEAVPF